MFGSSHIYMQNHMKMESIKSLLTPAGGTPAVALPDTVVTPITSFVSRGLESVVFGYTTESDLGRIVTAKVAFSPGDVIIEESPLLNIKLSLDGKSARCNATTYEITAIAKLMKILVDVTGIPLERSAYYGVAMYYYMFDATASDREILQNYFYTGDDVHISVVTALEAAVDARLGLERGRSVGVGAVFAALRFNAIGLQEQEKEEEKEEEKEKENTCSWRDGEGMFPAAAMLQHSCCPNAMFDAGASDLRIRAVAAIAVGEAISVPYCSVEVLRLPTTYRRAALKADRDFWCECVRCLAQDSCRALPCPGCKRRASDMNTDTDTSVGRGRGRGRGRMLHSLAREREGRAGWQCETCDLSVDLTSGAASVSGLDSLPVQTRVNTVTVAGGGSSGGGDQSVVVNCDAVTAETVVALFAEEQRLGTEAAAEVTAPITAAGAGLQSTTGNRLSIAELEKRLDMCAAAVGPQHWAFNQGLLSLAAALEDADSLGGSSSSSGSVGLRICQLRTRYLLWATGPGVYPRRPGFCPLYGSLEAACRCVQGHIMIRQAAGAPADPAFDEFVRAVVQVASVFVVEGLCVPGLDAHGHVLATLQAHLMNHCGHCGRAAAAQCTKCQKVVYCGSACQRSHWRTHKRHCCL